MPESGSELSRKTPLRTLVSVLLVIVITMSSSVGCIDKGIVDSLVELVEGDDGPDYVWEQLPPFPKSGNFVLEPEGDSDIDYLSILTKVAENMSNFDPTQTPINMKKIMNEENVSMRKFRFTFFVVEATYNLNIELTGIFSTSIMEDVLSGGYMELTIIYPDDSDRGSVTEELTQIGKEDNYVFPQEPFPGKWVIELQGIGLQSPADVIYSGGYVISVRAEMPK